MQQREDLLEHGLLALEARLLEGLLRDPLERSAELLQPLVGARQLRAQAVAVVHRRLVQPVRTLEREPQCHGCGGENRGEGQHAIGDRRLAPKPFAIHAVIGRVRVCENHVRMPVGPYALDHEDMPVVVAPGPDPRAVKAGNLGRHIRRRHFDVELVRKRYDGLRIDS